MILYWQSIPNLVVYVHFMFLLTIIKQLFMLLNDFQCYSAMSLSCMLKRERLCDNYSLFPSKAVLYCNLFLIPFTLTALNLETIKSSSCKSWLPLSVISPIRFACSYHQLTTTPSCKRPLVNSPDRLQSQATPEPELPDLYPEVTRCKGFGRTAESAWENVGWWRHHPLFLKKLDTL